MTIVGFFLDLEVERGAFRVDVCGHQFSVPADQAPAAEVEKQLLQLLQPANSRLRAQAAAAVQAGVSAIDALMQPAAAAAAATTTTTTTAAQARLRRTRRRESTALEAKELRDSLKEVRDSPKQETLNQAMALFTPGAAWDAAAAPGIVRAGLGVVVGAQAARAAVVVECADDVVDGVLSF
ncbi:hypothetical protein GGF42_001343, partial [Coemansia sp. RSA 2424]